MNSDFNFRLERDQSGMASMPEIRNEVRIAEVVYYVSESNNTEPMVIQLLFATPVTKWIWKKQSYYQST